jgi:protein import protein ZIM17
MLASARLMRAHRVLPYPAGARTLRMVNPVAWDRGLVIVQCSGCESWHKLADATNMVEEIRYADLPAESSVEE